MRAVLRVFNLILLGAAASLACAQEASRPNIVFIMTDDLGYGDIGSYGGPDIDTPNIDRLASQGARFTSFYANAAACSPTRTGFMTGRYQQRYGIERPLPRAETSDGLGLYADGRSLSQLLKNNGYATGLIGKWHLGHAENQSPQAHGFDYFFGFKSGFVDHYQHTDGGGQGDLWENDDKVEVAGYMTDLITQRSVDFIEHNRGRPFFLSVQYNAPHWPYQPPDMPSVARRNAAHLQPDEEDTSSRQDYIAMVERVDEGVGAILTALEAADLDDNTFVIFTNDNGGEWLSRNAPLFNRKLTVWEGGIRVPAVMRWPGVIPAGLVTNQVGITMDVTATILAAAKAEVPRDLDLEGINLLPILSGASQETQRTLFWRYGDMRAVRSGDLKLVRQGRFASFVFNVRDDVAERNDLTNVSQHDARRLRGLLDGWEADVDADRNPHPAP